jgi:hypothetical protein
MEASAVAKELEAIEIGDLPDLLHLAEEVQRTGRPRLLRRQSEDVAVLMPAPPPRKRPKGRALTPDDALFRLIGIGKSGIPGGVSGKKHEYLARAYRPK